MGITCNIKMIATIRASKRIALGGAFAFALVILCLLAVKDLNDKLGVMTASNAGYQKMTDSQTEKIRSLTTELEALRVSKVSELKASENERRRVELKSDNLQKEIDSLIDDEAHMEHDRDEIKELMWRQKRLRWNFRPVERSN